MAESPKPPDDDEPRASFTDDARDIPKPDPKLEAPPQTSEPQISDEARELLGLLSNAEQQRIEESEAQRPAEVERSAQEAAKRKTEFPPQRQRRRPDPQPESPHSLGSIIINGHPDERRRQEQEDLRKREELIAREEALARERREAVESNVVVQSPTPPSTQSEKNDETTPPERLLEFHTNAQGKVELQPYPPPESAEERILRKREELLQREESLQAQRRLDRGVDLTRNAGSASEVMDDFARQAELDRREKLIEREEALRQSQPIGAYASVFKNLDDEGAKQPPVGVNKKTGNSVGWLALGFALVERALDVIGFKNLIIGALLFVGAFVAFVFWFVGWEKARQWRFSKRALIIFISALVYFPLVGYQLYVQFKSEHPEKPSIVAVPSPLPTAAPMPSPTVIANVPTKNLHDYFSEQGGNCWRETVEKEVTLKNKKFKVEAQMCMDFNKKAEHLAFYIPYEVEKSTSEVCARLIDTHEAIIREFIQRFQGTMEAGPLGGRATQVKDLRFTRYLVFFHEQYITQDKLDLLDAKARRRGLITEFNSQQYVLARMPK